MSWIGVLALPPLRPLFETPLIKNPLKSSRSPFTTVLWPFSKSTPVTLTAPGAICIRSYTLRPFSGRLAICVDVTVEANLESSTFTAAASPVTSTTSLASPSCILKSTCAMVPAFSVTLLLLALLNPGASTEIL